MIKALVKKKKL